jgi:hypothetical protein
MGVIQNKSILIPGYITKYCIYTIHFMLLTSVVAFFLNYRFISLLFFLLYIIGIIYWSKPSLTTIRRKIDIGLIVLTFSYLTYLICSKFKKKIKKIFISVGFIILCAMIINEILFYYGIVGVDKKELFNNEESNNILDYIFLNVEYTNPNTSEREKECYIVIIMHCIFGHILPNLLASFCLICNTFTII